MLNISTFGYFNSNIRFNNIFDTIFHKFFSIPGNTSLWKLNAIPFLFYPPSYLFLNNDEHPAIRICKRYYN